MTKAEQYARKHLELEVRDIKNSKRNEELPVLSIYEKAIIYKYSEDGYISVNELLRDSKGTKVTPFGSVLNSALRKLDNHRGLVYRCVNLSPQEQRKYKDAEKSGEKITEWPFISTTKSEIMSHGFGKNTKFVIFSKTGKDIERIAKFGLHNPSNEKEVLFRMGRSFLVLEVKVEDGYTLITMEEV